MLFTSYEFLLFLMVVFCLYYLIPGKGQWLFLLAASYVFYYMANPVWLLYIIILTLVVWAAARIVAGRKHRIVFWLALAVIFGGLAALKYTDIFSLRFGILAPMGVSFYTIQSVGYLTDVYKKKYPAENNVLKLALFISFFPQLVQGPIGRFDKVAATMFVEHKAEWKQISYGLQRILWGYFKKLVIADRMAPAVQTIIGNPDIYDGGFVLAGMIFYAVQLYADFTGGIDITIGVAQVLGIGLPENFCRPYFSKSVKEYWTRWHITMGAWFRDYVFYPVSVCRPMLKLGKFSRKHLGQGFGKRLPVYLASLLVWLATGIWHGSGWNFVVWGLLNFLVIAVSQELTPVYRLFHGRFAVADKGWYQGFQVLRTIFIMSCLRAFDCYRDVPLTFRMLGSMVVDFDGAAFTKEAFLSLGLAVSDYVILLLGTVLCLFVSLRQRKGSVREQIGTLPLPVKCVLWYGLFVVVLLFGAYGTGYDASRFIYHQMVTP